MEHILLHKSPGHSIFSQNPTLLSLHITLRHVSDPHNKMRLISPPLHIVTAPEPYPICLFKSEGGQALLSIDLGSRPVLIMRYHDSHSEKSIYPYSSLREAESTGMEVFLLKRHEKSSFMGGNYVYPGGRRPQRS